MNKLHKILGDAGEFRKESAMEITTQIGCSVACSYCPQKILINEYSKRSDILYLKMDVFKICMDKIPSSVHIVFGGMSEPFLNPGCVQMILHAFKNGRKIGITTTTVGMKLSDLDSLENIPFEFFYLHLPGAEGVEKIKADEGYLRIVEKLSKSNIRVCYICHGKKPPERISACLKGKPIYIPPTITRSGNIAIPGRLMPTASKGEIGCKRNCRWNVLLPNADVLLCSNDYGLKHVLGNLLTSEYESLFKSAGYLKVKTGLRKADDIDILCRTCDTFSYPLNKHSELLCLPYQFLQRLKHSLYSFFTRKHLFYP